MYMNRKYSAYIFFNIRQSTFDMFLCATFMSEGGSLCDIVGLSYITGRNGLSQVRWYSGNLLIDLTSDDFIQGLC